jgi:YbbR domain-containing protein
MSTRSRMKKIYNSKAFWMIVSLLASLAIWVYVTSVETDEIKTTFRGVKVELVGEDILRDSKNLVVTDLDTSTVTVEVVGPRRIIGSLSSDQLVAQVDVSKLSRASYTSQQYTIVYPDGTDTSKLSESRRTPETINFMVSTQTSKSIQVRGSFDGSLAEGYTAEMPVFEPSTITITGSEAYLKDVEYAWVTFGKENVDSTYSVETGFTLMDANNEPCSTTGITFSTDVVTATLPLLTLKEVNLDVNIVEGAGATKANTKITIDPTSVTLAGDSSLLAGMNKIILATIDLTDFSSTFTETYTIPIDNELKNTTGVTKATVTIEIVGLETKTFTVTNFSCINATEGYEADIITESKEITLRGTPEALAQIKSENIRAVADLADYKESTGTYMPQVKVYVDGFTDVGAIGENTISIEIKKVS